MVTTPTTEELNRQQAVDIVETCLRHGIDHFFIAPGSRCTPLTIALANCDLVEITQHFDERALAFACLGFGRATGRPGAFVCTSGTAVANAYPAVIEASLDEVPMLLLTADRPPELHGIGSNQTIDQQNIFGSYPKAFVNPLSTGEQNDGASVFEIIAGAIKIAMTGPVHVNCMFREPFGESDVLPATSDDLPSPCHDAQNVRRTDPQDNKFDLPRGDSLVVLGGCRPHDASSVVRFAHAINAPLLADVTSGVRGVNYDLALLRNDLPTPRNVFHFGKRFISKRLLQFLASTSIENVWQIGSHQQRIDPCQKCTKRFSTLIVDFCAGANTNEKSTDLFLKTWTDACQRVSERARSIVEASTIITEPRVALEISRRLPSGSGLFLGNSMPIRDMDMFGVWPFEKSILVGANRGASGIDGLLASTVGFAAGIGKPTTLVIGDLSMLHDLNSLALLKNSRQPIIVVIVNNNGGGIFHLLPVATKTRHFERFFGTPHFLSFDRVAEQFSLPYTQCELTEQFQDGYEELLKSNRSGIIEVMTDREENAYLHRYIAKEIRSLP